ncbi:histone PARylation factor 1-like [Eupeodes corollae]|uniref:histone PARylation factor 1-like n=1 Tax=Eupeodes corollae TaxID=290404 RepID=UPI00248FB098|nr:histone PARylation factor 1-like [Eupeodes corollae]
MGLGGEKKTKWNLWEAAAKYAKVEFKSPGYYLRHWRFFYDPPDFQTLFVKRGNGIYYGVMTPRTCWAIASQLDEKLANIKKILSALDQPGEFSKEEAKDIVMEKLQPIITASVIALDECDFGKNLELGIDLFFSGHKNLHEIVQNLLNPAYKLLERKQ